MVLGDGVGQLLQQDRLPSAWRRHDQATLSLADRTHQVDHAHRQVVGDHVAVQLREFGDVLVDHALGARLAQVQPLLGVEWGQIVEQRHLLADVGVLVIDRLDLQQGEVALAVLGRAHLAADRVAGAQIELLDLARRQVDVVGTGQVVVVGAAEESVALGQHLQDALGEDQPVALGLGLEQTEDQLLLAQVGDPFEFVLLGDLEQFADGLLFQRREVQALGPRPGLGPAGLVALPPDGRAVLFALDRGGRGRETLVVLGLVDGHGVARRRGRLRRSAGPRTALLLASGLFDGWGRADPAGAGSPAGKRLDLSRRLSWFRHAGRRSAREPPGTLRRARPG